MYGPVPPEIGIVWLYATPRRACGMFSSIVMPLTVWVAKAGATTSKEMAAANVRRANATAIRRHHRRRSTSEMPEPIEIATSVLVVGTASRAGTFVGTLQARSGALG